jgi:hypothetical protein
VLQPRGEHPPGEGDRLGLVAVNLLHEAGQPVVAQQLTQALRVSGDLAPVARQCGIDLEVKLQAVGTLEAKRLLLIGLRVGQLHGALRQLVGVAMSLQRGELRRQHREDGIRRRRGLTGDVRKNEQRLAHGRHPTRDHDENSTKPL